MLKRGWNPDLVEKELRRFIHFRLLTPSVMNTTDFNRAPIISGVVMEQSRWKIYAKILLYIVGLIIFLEFSSSLVLNNLISPSRMEHFNGLFLKAPTEYWMLPHPYLGYVTKGYITEWERYLGYLGEDRRDKIYVVALGGSTTESGFPSYTEQYLNAKLNKINSSLKVIVFNFGVGGWSSLTSLQNYVYLVRSLHPDFVVIHHNYNDFDICRQLFLQAVPYYPQISAWERTVVRNSRSYRLLKFAYLLSYNPIRYGRGVVYNEPNLPMQTRISSYLNNNEPHPDDILYFQEDFTGGKPQSLEVPPEFPLTEIYESLIKYTRFDNSTPIITTQYLNCPKFTEAGEGERERCENESRDINNLLKDISAKHNVQLVDLDAEMASYNYLQKNDGVHFVKEGIRIKGELVGEAIFEILKKQYKLNGSQGEPGS